MMTLHVPIFMCGGASVGLALAVELGGGVRCLLVERSDGTVDAKMSQVQGRCRERSSGVKASI